MADRIQAAKVSCLGGLDTNKDLLTQAERYPGSALQLINYEPSTSGGYRRISGYANNYGTVPGEGGVLGINVFDGINNGIFACRKPAAGTDYFYRWNTGTSAWVAVTTPGTVTMVGVKKVRFENLTWGVNKMVLVDGVNPAAVYDGTTYTQITASTAPAAPKYVTQFANHLFLAGDSSAPYNLYFSAPTAETNFTPAAGAGVINVGFPIVQIKSFRDVLYIFGKNAIKRMVGTSIADFNVQEVTNNLGCIVPDSVVEFAGNLVFLSYDGFRPIAGTARIGDIELENLSKQIQATVNALIDEIVDSNLDVEKFNSIVYNKKSQFRFLSTTDGVFGILAGLRRTDQGIGMEFGQLFDMTATAAANGLINTEEILLHGDASGKVYKQEVGSNFDSRSILSIYQTPYYYFEDPTIRKNFYNVTTFLRADGAVNIAFAVSYDFDDSVNVFNPADYDITTQYAAAFYNSAIYDSVAVYDGNPSPVVKTNISGSGFSVSFTYVTNDTNLSHNIQGLVMNFSYNDRR
jgi:hypothetical protein